MSMTRAQRNSFRHSLEGVKEIALSTAKSFNEATLVYRARNGFHMTHREAHYTYRQGDKPVGVVFPDGRWEERTEFPPTAYKQIYRAIPCPCGHPACKNWFVDPVAAVQGVGFSEKQALAVADFLNRLETK